jgi:hypothetical protein
MTLRPAALSCRALSVTAIVADGFTRSSAADKNDISISSKRAQIRSPYLRLLHCSGKQKPQNPRIADFPPFGINVLQSRDCYLARTQIFNPTVIPCRPTPQL